MYHIGQWENWGKNSVIVCLLPDPSKKLKKLIDFYGQEGSIKKNLKTLQEKYWNYWKKLVEKNNIRKRGKIIHYLKAIIII